MRCYCDWCICRVYLPRGLSWWIARPPCDETERRRQQKVANCVFDRDQLESHRLPGGHARMRVAVWGKSARPSHTFAPVECGQDINKDTRPRAQHRTSGILGLCSSNRILAEMIQLPTKQIPCAKHDTSVAPPVWNDECRILKAFSFTYL